MSVFSLVLLTAFAASCVLLISAAFHSRAGMLHFPFLAGAGLLGFLVPQAIGIVRNPEMAPGPGIDKALLMCTLCALAIHYGWRSPIPYRWKLAARRCPLPRMYSIGLALMAVGLAGFYKLTSLSGGIAAHYSSHGNYSLKWSGLPVVYSFLADYLVAGLALCTLAAFALKSNPRLLPPAVAVAIQLATIVFLGRRSAAVNLLVFFGCTAWFAKLWLPPRSFWIAAAPLAAIAMFLAPEYRSHSQLGADHERIKDIGVRQTLAKVFDGTPAEFWSLCHLVQITDDTGLYQYGAGLYNAFIADFVPKLLVGEDRKQALLIPMRNAEHVPNAYVWEMPYGMVSTGPGTAYREFWFFGCLYFYFLARFMRYLWTRAETAGDLLAKAAYMLSATPAIASVTNDMCGIYGPIFTFWLPLVLLTNITAPARLSDFRRVGFNPRETLISHRPWRVGFSPRGASAPQSNQLPYSLRAVAGSNSNERIA